MNSEKIGFMEAIALISVVMINKIILNTPKEINFFYTVHLHG